MDHPTYSPDLMPTDFQPSEPLKKHLAHEICNRCQHEASCHLLATHKCLYQWRLSGGPMCTMCNPSAMCNQSVTSFIETPLYYSQKNIIFSVTMAQILRNKDMYRMEANFVY
jgi:hypothetical protein